MSAPLTAPAGAPAAEPDSGAPVIQTSALSKRYPGPVTALDALTVTVAPGITGLVGANGAGKSTLIKILLGLLEPTGGEARVFGRDCQRDGEQIRGLTGYMPEHDCLPPDVTATEFVTHLGRMSGLPPTAAKERAAESLRHVGLYEERYRQIGTYSTGMKQRVKLAQALVGDPRLLLLDEPTVGLDPAGRDSMLELIARIGAEFGISDRGRLAPARRDRADLRSPGGDRGRPLLRADTITSMTQVSQVLLVDVDEGSDELLAELGRRGLEPRRHERSLLVDLSGDAHVRHRPRRDRGPGPPAEPARAAAPPGGGTLPGRRRGRAGHGGRRQQQRRQRHKRRRSERHTGGTPCPLRPESSTTSATAGTPGGGWAGPRSSGALYWHSLRSAFGLGRGAKAKIVPVIVFVIMCLPAIASAVTVANGNPRPVPYDTYVFQLRVVLMIIFVAAQAPELVSRDLRSHVLPLYFCRPLRRMDYPLAKLAAFITACLAIIEIPLVLLYLGTVAPSHGPHASGPRPGRSYPACSSA